MAPFVVGEAPRRSASSLDIRKVPDPVFVSVGVYPDPISVRVASGLLTTMGVAHRISPPRMYYLAARNYYLLVAPEMVEEAKRILETSVVSEEELGKLASKEPPPDDM